MKTMKFFKNMLIGAVVMALALAALPFTVASAAGQADPTPPPAPQGERLERIWQREQRRYERMSRLFDKSDGAVQRVETLIGVLKARGEDTAQLEAALQAFVDASKKARPIYESCKGIINSHKGFDDNGKVTDREQAIQTVKELGAKFKEVRAALNGTPKALLQLLKSIRDAHRPASTPTPTGA